jgi:hypothetical protein
MVHEYLQGAWFNVRGEGRFSVIAEEKVRYERGNRWIISESEFRVGLIDMNLSKRKGKESLILDRNMTYTDNDISSWAQNPRDRWPYLDKVEMMC